MKENDSTVYKTPGQEGFHQTYNSYKKTINYWIFLILFSIILITSLLLSNYINVWFLAINLIDIIPAYLIDKDMERYLNKRGFTLKNNK